MPELKNRLIAEFRSFLATDAVLHAEEDLKPYECDGLTAYHQLPLLVLLPETTAQVQRILRSEFISARISHRK